MYSKLEDIYYKTSEDTSLTLQSYLADLLILLCLLIQFCHKEVWEKQIHSLKSGLQEEEKHWKITILVV